jgi:DNA polymerase-3 subunit alpha
MSTCVPLHVHSEGSVRDSINKISNYVQKCVELKYTAASISDHGFMGYNYKFYKECKKYNIKPILGQEFYYTHDRADKGLNYHLVLYAMNEKGYQNLCKLSSDAFINGFYRKARTDKTILAEYSEGLICTPACCFGMAQQYIVNGEMDNAIQEVKDLQSIFKENFYLEIHDHGIEDEIKIKDEFRNIGNDLNIKVVPGIDVHYTNKEDQKIHGIFKNIAYASGGEKDSSFNGTDFHVLSPEEMAVKFTKEELDNTLEIADKCNVDFKFTGYFLPTYDIPEKEFDTYEYLRTICFRELKKKGLDSNPLYVERLEFELNMLHLADLENYLLIVSDYCNWAKNNDVPVGPGRGSMGGSIVSWLTNITGVDPLKYDLLFARAINPGRSLQFDFGV